MQYIILATMENRLYKFVKPFHITFHLYSIKAQKMNSCGRQCKTIERAQQVIYRSSKKFTVGYFHVKFVRGEIFLSLGVSNE